MAKKDETEGEMGAASAGTGAKVAQLAWENRGTIAKVCSTLRRWLRKSNQGEIVILGLGGTGKDTLAKVLISDGIPVTLPLSDYKESSDVENYELKRPKASPVKIVTLPGQKHRRASTWPQFLRRISAGEIRGVILMNCYGYHSIGNANIKSMKQWKGRRDRFLKAYLDDRRTEELNLLSELVPALKSCGKKFWMLNVTCKQDLWWKEKDAVYSHYREGEFRRKLDELMGPKDPLNMRIEQVFCSLTISSFRTGTDEVLQPNAAGYDLQTHGESIRRLIEVLEGVRRWEAR
ncbi:MAG: hypothetical protein QM770_02545 [Tepidisphaeraceae bacterium]